MAGSLSPEAGRSQGGGCNRDLCAEKWGTLFPQLFPSSPSSPCLETLVTSPLAQSLRVKVSPRKREQSWNKTYPSVPPPARHLPCALSPLLQFPSSGCRGCDQTPSFSHRAHASGRLFRCRGQEPRSQGVAGSPAAGPAHAGQEQELCSPALPLPREARLGEDALPLRGLPGAPSVPTQPRAEVMAGAGCRLGAGEKPQVHQSSGRTRKASARGE